MMCHASTFFLSMIIVHSSYQEERLKKSFKKRQSNRSMRQRIEVRRFLISRRGQRYFRSQKHQISSAELIHQQNPCRTQKETVIFSASLSSLHTSVCINFMRLLPIFLILNVRYRFFYSVSLNVRLQNSCGLITHLARFGCDE